MPNRFFRAIPDPDPADTQPSPVGNFAEWEAGKRERQLVEGEKTDNPARPIKHYIYELDYFDE
ncbi:hypothetical protein [Rhodococcus sp. YH3-3]|uniref:hypothetical protein n=1 Tax=Rhodococcus sp. YH3-3 TaxID=1803579 RepID=UPI0007DB52D2|nr:hypothetical protein [Rhodococcus sp. YH3-3]